MNRLESLSARAMKTAAIAALTASTFAACAVDGPGVSTERSEAIESEDDLSTTSLPAALACEQFFGESVGSSGLLRIDSGQEDDGSLTVEDTELFTSWGVSIADMVFVDDIVPCEDYCEVNKYIGPTFDIVTTDFPQPLGEADILFEGSAIADWTVVPSVKSSVALENTNVEYYFAADGGLLEYPSGIWEAENRTFLGRCPAIMDIVIAVDIDTEEYGDTPMQTGSSEK